MSANNERAATLAAYDTRNECSKCGGTRIEVRYDVETDALRCTCTESIFGTGCGFSFLVETKEASEKRKAAEARAKRPTVTLADWSAK